LEPDLRDLGKRFRPVPASALVASALTVVLLVLSAPLGAQAPAPTLVINEVIAENETQAPTDIGGGHPDMVEIHNATDGEITLGGTTPESSYFLSDQTTFTTLTAWRFPNGTKILARGYVVVFCDGNALEGLCELHSSFSIENDGTEPVTLWGPRPQGGTDADRPVIDRVFLPPLRANVSFGRFPDGAGPAPVPVEETRNFFSYFPAGKTTFGSCIEPGSICPGGSKVRVCFGSANQMPGNLEPRLDLVAHTTNHPGAQEAVTLTARVDDDLAPTPGNITRVEIRYSVNGVEQPPVPMTYDEATGILNGANLTPPRPLDIWTHWLGTIPGQPAGARIAFDFLVEDRDGLSSTDPRDPCPGGVGPCNEIGLPGPGCVKERDEMGNEGLQYVPCSHRRQYLSGYTPPGGLAQVLVNEVAAFQDRLLEDRSDPPCGEDEDPRCRFDDFIELCNGGETPVDLSGLWLSDSPFRPKEWAFPAKTMIQPGEYLIVWTDSDGGRCPRPPAVIGDGQQCPDPTEAARKEFHTNFEFSSEGDEVYLYDREENGFGVIHGVEFGPQALNFTLS
jgi:hypothetical protein